MKCCGEVITNVLSPGQERITEYSGQVDFIHFSNDVGLQVICFLYEMKELFFYILFWSRNLSQIPFMLTISYPKIFGPKKK